MNMPKAVKRMLTIKNNTHISIEWSKGMNDTMYNAKSVKYPKRKQFIN